MLAKLTPNLIQKALRTYMPTLATQVVRPEVQAAKWGLRVFIPDENALDVFVSRGEWHWFVVDGPFREAFQAQIADGTGAQTISVFIAEYVVKDIMNHYGTDDDGRLLPSTSPNYRVAAQICAEGMGFLAALAVRGIPFTDDADKMARWALESIEKEYTKQ